MVNVQDCDIGVIEFKHQSHYLWYMYKPDLALNKLQGVIYHEPKQSNIYK